MDEETLFHRAVEKPAAERSAFLDDACGGDEALRQRVQTLLDAHEAPASFLNPPGGTAAILDPILVSTRPGTVIGRYKLLEPIGEGGYGTVFMAEQTSPVHRKVALKIIKAGMDTRQVIARFEAERQALALMDHPNIAKVFDAGVTDTGRPYFVMELVKGVPITRYCDEHRLPPRARLELFVQVCQAVQHAHQKGIIHRDLKPTNVLVAQYDGQPVPKVIDFGVAKAMGQQLTERTLFTGFGDVIGTPQYMSPEQAELNQLDVDTRSDIYSLGVLLYELLTGSTPLEAKRMKEAALLEILRVIREEEPPRPSTRLTKVDELPSIAAQRGLEPKKLTGVVHGELDWIVMKALEKDRSRRYETANGFARDVERYLHDEPVQACPPSTAYRFRKFARRNKGALAAASAMLAMLLLLVAGLAVSNVRVARERNQKAAALKEKEQALAAAKASAERAEAERQRAESNFVKARTAVTSILAKAATGQDQWSKLSPELRKVFSDQTALYYQSLIQEGSTDPSVRFETAVGYRSLGYLHTSAKEHEQAEKHYRQSIQMLETLVTESGGDTNYRHQLAWSQSLLGAALRATKRPADAQAAYERSAEIYERLIADAPGNADYPTELWKCYNVLLQIYRASGAHAEVRRIDERSERLSRELVRLAPNDANAHGNLGRLLEQRGKLDEAVAAYRKAIELDPSNAARYQNLGAVLRQQEKFGEAAAAYGKAIELNPSDAGLYQNLGVILDQQEKFDEAVAAYRKGIELDPSNASVYQNLGVVLGGQGKLEEAAAATRKAIEINPKAAGAYVNLGGVLARQSKFDEAAAAYRMAIDLAPKDGRGYGNVGRPQRFSAQVAGYQSLAKLLHAQGKLDEAVAVWRELIERDPKLAGAHSSLGDALLARNDHAEAIAAYKDALAIDPEHAQENNHLARLLATCSDTRLRDPALAVALAQKAVALDPNNAAYLSTLGVARYRSGDWNGAIADLEESMAMRQGGDSFDWFFLAMARWQLGETDAAREWYDRAVKWMENKAPNNEELVRFRSEAAELLKIDQQELTGASSSR